MLQTTAMTRMMQYFTRRVKLVLADAHPLLWYARVPANAAIYFHPL
jgi:hypothetical protein